MFIGLHSRSEAHVPAADRLAPGPAPPLLLDQGTLPASSEGERMPSAGERTRQLGAVVRVCVGRQRVAGGAQPHHALVLPAGEGLHACALGQCGACRRRGRVSVAVQAQDGIAGAVLAAFERFESHFCRQRCMQIDCSDVCRQF